MQGRLTLTIFLLLSHNRGVRAMHHYALFLLHFNMISAVFSEVVLGPEKGADSQRTVAVPLILLITGVLRTVRPITRSTVLFQNTFLIFHLN